MIANFMGVDIKSGMGCSLLWLTTSYSIGSVTLRLETTYTQNVSAFRNHPWLQQYAREAVPVLLFEFDIRMKSHVFELVDALWPSKVDSSVCTKKHIARAGSLEVRHAVEPRAKPALCIEKQSGVEMASRHGICGREGAVCGCASRCCSLVFLCHARLHNS